jgi:hypothetical protein
MSDEGNVNTCRSKASLADRANQYIGRHPSVLVRLTLLRGNVSYPLRPLSNTKGFRLSNAYLEHLPSSIRNITVVVQNVYEQKVVTTSNFIVIGIVGWGNPNGTTSNLHIDSVIGDNWDSTIGKRVGNEFAMEMLPGRVE